MTTALPAPPDPLPRLRRTDVVRVAAGTRLWRVYPQAGRGPGSWQEFRSFGPLATGRFDPHLPPPREQDRGVLYAAVRRPATGVPALFACLAEVFQDTRVIDPYDRSRWVAGFAVTRPVALLDLTGPWPTRAGGNQALCSGPREPARAWARAIYEQYDVDGVYYGCSTYGPGRAVALFDRAAPAVPRHPVFHRPLGDPGLRRILRAAATHLGYDLI